MASLTVIQSNEERGLAKMESVSRKLSEWVTKLDYKSIPAEFVEAARLDILDMFGCGLFGSTRNWVRTVTTLEMEWGGKPEATLWGYKTKIPCVNAVMANAHAVNAFEFDDTYNPTGIHPGALVVTSAFASAELVGGISGRELISAVVAGHEVSARVRNGLGWSVLHGWNGTAICSTFGAAAASAKILGLNENQTVDALGIAGPYVGGLLTYGFKAMAKRLVNARAAQGGILAALLAQRGFTGYEDILESKQGGFCTAHSSDCKIENITQGIGQEYEMRKMALKKYPVCTSFHAVLDAVSELENEHNIDPASVERVIVNTTSGALKNNVGIQYDNISSAQMSMQYSVAARMIDGTVGVDQFTETRVKSTDVRRMAQLVEIVVDPELERMGLDHRMAAKVDVVLKDGSRLESSTVRSPKIMTTQDVFDKFMVLASVAVPERQAKQLLDMVRALEKQNDVSSLAALLSI